MEYSYRIEFASAGSEPAAAMLNWKPTSADTGWHAIRYAATGSCEDKVFLMAYVGPKPVTSVRPSSAAAKARTDLRWIRPGGFGIVLDAPASVELLSLTGRTLAKYGRLAGGLHSLAFPSGMRGDAMVLCRIRHSGGDAWLKIPRSH